MTVEAYSVIDSSVAWWRLAATLAMATLGGVGMWSVVVALPAVQAGFGVDRAAASLPYTMTMVGFGLGGILMGRLSDRYGVSVPLAGATLAMAAGYVLASLAPTLVLYALAQGLLVAVSVLSRFAGFDTRARLAIIASASGVIQQSLVVIVDNKKCCWYKTFIFQM